MSVLLITFLCALNSLTNLGIDSGVLTMFLRSQLYQKLGGVNKMRHIFFSNIIILEK